MVGHLPHLRHARQASHLVGACLQSGGGAAALSYDDEVLSDGPVAYWVLADGGGPAPMSDSSGNGYSGTYSPSGTSEVFVGPFGAGGATGFDGSSGYASAVSVPDPASALSFDLWVRPASLTSGPMLVSSIPGGWYLYWDGSALQFWPNTSSGAVVSATIVTGAWHHMALTHDAATNTTRMFMDGGELGVSPASSGTFGPNANGIMLGSYIGASRFLDGRLSRVAIYHAVLSPTRIAAHYAAAVAAGLH